MHRILRQIIRLNVVISLLLIGSSPQTMNLVFNELDTSISTAQEISVQGSNVYIILADGTLKYWNGTNFAAHTKPSFTIYKVLASQDTVFLTINSGGVSLYKYTGSSWMSLASGTITVQDFTQGFGPIAKFFRTSLYETDADGNYKIYYSALNYVITYFGDSATTFSSNDSGQVVYIKVVNNI